MAAKPSDPFHVYGLSDPDSGLLRYIGVTQTPDVRRRAVCNGSGTTAELPVTEWVLGLKARRIKPIFRILLTLSGPEARLAAFQSEALLIRTYAKLPRFADLLNIRCNPFAGKC
jgi:hypothetical protein